MLTLVNQYGQPTNYSEQLAYPGVATWLLAAIGITALWARWRVRLYAAVAALAALLMYGTHGISQLYSWVPIAGLAVPSRFGLLTITGLIILAAHGVDVLMRERSTLGPWVFRAPGLVVAAMAAVVTASLWWAWPALRTATLLKETTLYVAFAGVLACVTLAVLWVGQRRMSAHATAALLTALVIVDLFAMGWRLHPLIPRDQVFPTPHTIAAVRADPGLFRVAGLGRSLLPNTAMAYGLQDPRGYDGVFPRRYCELLERAFGAAAIHIIQPDGPLTCWTC